MSRAHPITGLTRTELLAGVVRAIAGISPFVLAAMLTGCGAKTPVEAAPGDAQQATPVDVQIVVTKPIADSTEYLALLKSRHSALINPQVEGHITKIFVKSGDTVKLGDPLLQIDPVVQQAAVGSQEATRAAQDSNVNLARINLERAKKLYEAGVVAKLDLDNAQTTYDTAVAQLKSLAEQVQQQRAQLHYYQVSAPSNGVVGDIPVRVGDRVAVSTLLTTVDEPGPLEAYIYVPAARARALRPGLPVTLLDETGVPRAESKISFISPQVDPETQTVLAKAPVANPQASLRISQQVRARVIWGDAMGPVIPVLGVNRINGQFFVFVAAKEAKGTFARQRLVKLGEIVGNEYAVLDGVSAGDHLIVSGTQFLQDGAPVTEQIQSQETDSAKASKPVK